MGRSAYDFEDHGLKNIRTYVRNFELPRPDSLSEKDWHLMFGQGPSTRPATDVNKSHKNTLESRHEKWRYLENIRPLSLEVISPLKWINTKLPNTRQEEEFEPRYKLASALPQMYSHAPIDIENMLPWLNLLFITATRVLHVSHPRTHPFAFQPGRNKANDKHIFQYLVWSQNGHEPSWEPCSVLVAYQPPYVLTVTDLEEFVSCKVFPPFNSFAGSLPSKYRLWAKIWDTCQLFQSSWFILTTYTHWVFGAFSKGMRVAFVSPVIQFNQRQPTILEHVIFWLSSAMRLPGTFRLPQVGDEDVHPYETPSTAYDILCFGHKTVDESVFAEFDIDIQPVAHTHRQPLSESFWLGRDESPGSSAHVDLKSELQGEGSLASHWAIPERSQSSATRGSIQTWLSTCRNAQHRVLDEDDLVDHILPEFELQESMREGELCGEWMIPT